MSYPAPPPPPAPDYFRASDHEGALTVWRVKEYDRQYSGWSEPQPAVRCDVEAIDPPAGPWHDAWTSNVLIVGQLKDSIGKVFFARLAKRGAAYALDPIFHGDEVKIDGWRQAKANEASKLMPPRPPEVDPTAATAELLRRNRVGAEVPAGDDVPF